MEGVNKVRKEQGYSNKPLPRIINSSLGLSGKAEGSD